MRKEYEYDLKTDKGTITLEVGTTHGNETCVMVKGTTRAFHSVEHANSVLLKENSRDPELTKAQQLATLLHDKQCHHNHDDGCGWYYESWDMQIRGFSVRKQYLEKAQAILNIVSFELAVRIVEVL